MAVSRALISLRLPVGHEAKASQTGTLRKCHLPHTSSKGAVDHFLVIHLLFQRGR